MNFQRIKTSLIIFVLWGCRDYTPNDNIIQYAEVQNGIWPLDTIDPFIMDVHMRRQGQTNWTYLGKELFIPKAPMFYADHTFIYEFTMTGPDTLNSAFSIMFQDKTMKVSRNNKGVMTAIDSTQLPGYLSGQKWDKTFGTETRAQANYISKSTKIGADSGNIFYSLYRRTITKPNLNIVMHDKEYYKLAVGLRHISSTRYISTFVNGQWQYDTVTYSFMRP